MNKVAFNMEELALIAATGSKCRSDVVRSISYGIPYTEDELSADIARGCAAKLLAITDDEFAALDLSEAKQFD